MTPEGDQSAVELAQGVTIPRHALGYSYARSAGPGGQSVNKLNTQATLRVRLDAIRGLDEMALGRLRRLGGRRITRDGQIVFRCGARRSQWQNRQTCLERLQKMVAKAAQPPKKRRKTRPTRAAVERRLQEKRRTGEKKQRRQSKRSHGDQE